MYLYIFEDGTLGQSQLPPTADDMSCVGDGVLQVVTLVGGKFVETAHKAAAEGRVEFKDIREVNQEEGYSV